MDQPGAHEGWAQRPDVLLLLGEILADPSGDHAGGVAKSLEGPLLDAHVASIVRALDLLRDDPAFAKSFTTDRGVALHTILYHLLGGAERGLPPPPRDSSRSETQRCAPGLKAASKMSQRFFTDRDEARRQEKGDNGAALQKLRGRVFAPATHKNLRTDADVLARAAKAAASAASAAPPAPPPADPADAELRRRTDCCMALAMGTHRRLGMSSALRLLTGEEDTLRLIAAHAELRTTVWLARYGPNGWTFFYQKQKLGAPIGS